jgi:hypothetical protein
MLCSVALIRLECPVGPIRYGKVTYHGDVRAMQGATRILRLTLTAPQACTALGVVGVDQWCTDLARLTLEIGAKREITDLFILIQRRKLFSQYLTRAKARSVPRDSFSVYVSTLWPELGGNGRPRKIHS